ncbi:MAG: hypothetical protein M4579_000836 [Chaenotheca gracillima]|nr:MAG: hypothetical protein M4579_000836 [Chaenotheca gracillima]
MVSSVKSPHLSIKVTVEPLTEDAFRPFGTVIANPVPHTAANSHARSPSQSVATMGVSPTTTSARAVSANQGTALKYVDVTDVKNLYERAPSRKRARVAMTMFVCSPREMKPSSPTSRDSVSDGGGLFPIKILERHPFTTQTFIPLGLSPLDSDTKYLVIVAPTLPPPPRTREKWPPPYPAPPPRRRRSLTEIFSRARPSPFPEEPRRSSLVSTKPSDSKERLPGPGPPDLTHIKAFLADGSQAVTYGAGTWHAPMVVLGKNAIDFVVVQYVNGVSQEDCQEVEITSEGMGEGIVAVVPALSTQPSEAPTLRVASKL